jgi:hypothetical protein
MIKIWSELPLARTREQIADVATLVWVVFWGNLVWQLFQFLVGFADVGRAVQAGGQNMTQAGKDLGQSLAGLPVIGTQVRDLASGAFAAGGKPMSDLGGELEQFITIVSIVLAALLAIVALGPRLNRYLPWRWERLRRVRSAHRAIRTAPDTDAGIQKTLAMRAVTRLDYPTLLDFTPDPLGDWISGRHDRLAKAEMASVGLRP